MELQNATLKTFIFGSEHELHSIAGKRSPGWNGHAYTCELFKTYGNGWLRAKGKERLTCNSLIYATVKDKPEDIECDDFCVDGHSIQTCCEMVGAKWLPAVLCWPLLVCMFAIVYRRLLKTQAFQAAEMIRPELTTWSCGNFSCRNCFMACCCTSVQWAENLSTMKQLDFWHGLGSLLGLYIVAFAFVPVTLPALILACSIQVHCRQQIRKEFGMHYGSCSSIASDSLCYGCCQCFAVLQETQHIAVAMVGHPVLTDPKLQKGREAAQAALPGRIRTPSFRPAPSAGKKEKSPHGDAEGS